MSVWPVGHLIRKGMTFSLVSPSERGKRPIA
jgi:hypothetical protein